MTRHGFRARRGIQESRAKPALSSSPWQKHLFRKNGDWLEFPPSATPSKREIGRGENSCLYPIFPADRVSPRFSLAPPSVFSRKRRLRPLRHLPLLRASW
jgi:hypothetical protein